MCCLEVVVGRPGNRFQLDSLPHDSDTAKMWATALPAEMIWVIMETRKHAAFQKDSFPQDAILNNKEYNNNNNE